MLLAACKLSCSVYISERHDPSYVRTDIADTVVFAFCGSLDPLVVTSTATKYGERQIDDVGLKRDWMKDGNGKPATVHGGALNQFLEIWNNSPVQQEARLAYEKGKTVVFTGHSMGGAIASLATLYMLDEQQPGKSNVFCITFGFPLIGDEVLARAVRRKRWADQFCHVVLRRDVFARILLAPCISVDEPLKALLPYWKRSMEAAVRHSMDPTDTSMEETLPEHIAEFVGTVVQHSSAIANYSSAAKLSPNNLLIAAVKPLVKLSPYKPFGNYIFCSNTGGIWIENHFAVLPILYYALQTSNADLENFILEHVAYDDILSDALQNIVKLELSDLPLSEAGSRITTQLDALGLGIQNCQARLSLRAAGQVMKQQIENLSLLEKEYPKKMESPMEKLAEYRSQCFRNETGYYDAFKKKQRGNIDFQANLNRLELAGWWDEIIQNKFNKDELPDDFQSSKEWIKRGTEYRLLVEPLDIANYYRLGKNEDAGPYLTHGRPSRYKTVEKWLENDAEQLQLPTELTLDSCLWAFVEENASSMQNNSYNDGKRVELENRLSPLIGSDGLCMEDLLKGESTFKTVVNWLLEEMPAEQRPTSPFQFIISHAQQTIQI